MLSDQIAQQEKAVMAIMSEHTEKGRIQSDCILLPERQLSQACYKGGKAGFSITCTLVVVSFVLILAGCCVTRGRAGIWPPLFLQPRCSDTFIYLHHRNHGSFYLPPSEGFYIQLHEALIPASLTVPLLRGQYYFLRKWTMACEGFFPFSLFKIRRTSSQISHLAS